MGVSMACEIRICPNAAQRELAERTFGCCRWACSRCLEARKAECERTGRPPSACQLDRMLPTWKAENLWLKEADSHALQQAVAALCRAYDNFFHRCRTGGAPGYPRFKSKRNARQSYRTNWGISVPDARHIKLPKLGLVKARISRRAQMASRSQAPRRLPEARGSSPGSRGACPASGRGPGEGRSRRGRWRSSMSG